MAPAEQNAVVGVKTEVQAGGRRGDAEKNRTHRTAGMSGAASRDHRLVTHLRNEKY